MDLYAENILDHYRHPRKKEPLREFSVQHTETNVSCGDELTVQLEIKDGNVVAIGWSGLGCAISQAAMSMLAEEMEGMTLDDLANMRDQDIYDLLGVPISPRRIQCALLGVQAVHKALKTVPGTVHDFQNMV